MKKEVRDMLEAPFPDSDIRQRKSSYGLVKYVDGATVLKRLNDTFDGDWSFEVVEYKILDEEVLVLGRLTVAGITRMAFGGSSITRARETGEIVSLVDDAKSACTDAIKKIASTLGVGLAQLYSDGRNNGSEKHISSQRNSPRSPRAQHRNNHSRNEGGNGDNQIRLSQRQLSAIWSLARKAGYSSDDIRKRSIECFKMPVEQLSKSDASIMIGDLSDELGDSAFNNGKKP